MIEIVSLAGLTAFVVASFIVGTRILMLAARTHRLPETTIGGSLFLAGGIGTALMIAPQLFSGLGVDTGHLLYLVGSAFSHVGFCLLFVFVWRVFRPQDAWATALFLVCAVALFAGAIGMTIELEPRASGMGREADAGVWFWSSIGGRFVGYSWASIESFRYYAMLKKRLALGLADETVVSRFFYWGLCTGAVVVIWISAAIHAVAAEREGVVAVTGLVTPLMGFVVAGSLWVAFFPRRRDGAPASDVVDGAGQGA